MNKRLAYDTDVIREKTAEGPFLLDGEHIESLKRTSNEKMALVTLLTFAVLMTSSCGLSQAGPGKVVEKFYRYVEKGELEAAKNLFAKPIQEAMGGEIITSLAKETREIKSKGGVKDIEIKNEEITGESAHVFARVIYGDGSNKINNTNLIKENGAWKYIEVRVGKFESENRSCAN